MCGTGGMCVSAFCDLWWFYMQKWYIFSISNKGWMQFKQSAYCTFAFYSHKHSHTQNTMHRKKYKAKSWTALNAFYWCVQRRVVSVLYRSLYLSFLFLFARIISFSSFFKLARTINLNFCLVFFQFWFIIRRPFIYRRQSVRVYFSRIFPDISINVPNQPNCRFNSHQFFVLFFLQPLHFSHNSTFTRKLNKTISLYVLRSKNRKYTSHVPTIALLGNFKLMEKHKHAICWKQPK